MQTLKSEVVRMSEFNHLVLVKFKEGVVIEDILKGMEKLVSDMDIVKSFTWGQDVESHEMLRQGFTHAFLMTFASKEDFTAFASHPNHVEFSTTFSAAIENAVLLDFPAVNVKMTVPDFKTEEINAVNVETVPDFKTEIDPVNVETVPDFKTAMENEKTM